jgi:hypothetical protein
MNKLSSRSELSSDYDPVKETTIPVLNFDLLISIRLIKESHLYLKPSKSTGNLYLEARAKCYSKTAF